MLALAAAVDDLFADPILAQDAVYTAAGGDAIAIRVIARRADAVAGFGDARLWSETARFDIRAAQVATPRPGDRIEIGGEAFLIQGEPVRDSARLVWTIDTHPA